MSTPPRVEPNLPASVIGYHHGSEREQARADGYGEVEHTASSPRLQAFQEQTTTSMQTIRLRLGHSPDSDDAFMFWGLASGRVHVPGIAFEHVLRDIETLNHWAREGRLEITAISVHAYAHVADKYAILCHGASMGDGYGPMVLTRSAIGPEGLQGKLVAVPGTMTSAFLAFRLWWQGPVVGEEAPEIPEGSVRYRVMPFDRIMDAVADGSVDAGLIIHEGQLTYADAGLHQLVDLGTWWQGRTHLPLPLGVNAIRLDLSADVQALASSAMRASIEAGLSNRDVALTHALTYARGLPARTADEFVSMYVNDWTLDLGQRGRAAIETFLGTAAAAGLSPAVPNVRFVS